MHNILQGVAKPDERISAEDQKTITEWITENANRYWFSKGGPLRPPQEGGADVVVVRKMKSLSYKLCSGSVTPPLSDIYLTYNG